MKGSLADLLNDPDWNASEEAQENALREWEQIVLRSPQNLRMIGCEIEMAKKWAKMDNDSMWLAVLDDLSEQRSVHNPIC